MVAAAVATMAEVGDTEVMTLAVMDTSVAGVCGGPEPLNISA